MKSSPMVSIVMGVHNGGLQLEKTIESVLAQDLSDLEFIIIDDGSTDETAIMVSKFESCDKRIRAYRQANQGLTNALILGCALARGRYIARQDAGDVSDKLRLSKQTSLLEKNEGVVLVACGSQFLAESGSLLYESNTTADDLDRGLRILSHGKLRGPPHHGGTMFRKDAYLKCGGYRKQFRVAQDIDLWLRLAEYGKCLGNSEILYSAVVAPNGISINRHKEQLAFQKLAIKCTQLRNQGCDDQELLDSFILSPSDISSNPAKQTAAYHYFIASCLIPKNMSEAKKHLEIAWKLNPLSIKINLKRIVATLY